jgi:hypothetical protein
MCSNPKVPQEVRKQAVEALNYGCNDLGKRLASGKKQLASEKLFPNEKESAKLSSDEKESIKELLNSIENIYPGVPEKVQDQAAKWLHINKVNELSEQLKNPSLSSGKRQEALKRLRKMCSKSNVLDVVKNYAKKWVKIGEYNEQLEGEDPGKRQKALEGLGEICSNPNVPQVVKDKAEKLLNDACNEFGEWLKSGNENKRTAALEGLGKLYDTPGVPEEVKAQAAKLLTNLFNVLIGQLKDLNTREDARKELENIVNNSNEGSAKKYAQQVLGQFNAWEEAKRLKEPPERKD